MQLNESLVRERAYKIWESEGRPEGCAEKHWSMACQYESSEHADLQDSYSTLGQEDIHQPQKQHSQQGKKGKHNRH